ncbi:hypothetical protein OSC27_01720 [Microbacterium sp. STN6]|uniref:hypothetical protein n=1 Tax=Microbacterium sp. STN6 TaxID=2995588 RepID=UPI002260A01E|nr:hypothetical protein [Microbacterium sp. STN6]MCX7520989.1 hypothetical protein [Microbacterium sp. STN6]
MITVPRLIFLGLGALFSAYHVFLGISTLGHPATPQPAIAAMVVYALATAVSIWPGSPVKMPLWLAAFDLAVCVALPLLVTSQLDGGADNGYATWHVAAVGTLMTICAVRRQQLIAWTGVLFLAVQTVVWGGFGALASVGVIGSVAWVGVAVVITRALVKAARDSRQFAKAEREATEWQAAQEAHVIERQFRLRKTYRVAQPMLTEIARTGGNLTPAQRQECRYLEQAIRDEIRGRSLLTDDVREQVMAARRRGTVVSLLDEGGLDDMLEEERLEILGRLADAIRGTRTDRLIVRTVPHSSRVAVTVVGLSVPGDGHANALGPDSHDDEVDLWLEIPRHPSQAAAPLLAPASPVGK